jgi:TIR domain
MARLTLSYRRSDSEALTGRIFDRLIRHYGRKSVFRDIDNVPVGVDFRTHIQDALQKSDILLAVVGAGWHGPRKGHDRIEEETGSSVAASGP